MVKLNPTEESRQSSREATGAAGRRGSGAGGVRGGGAVRRRELLLTRRSSITETLITVTVTEVRRQRRTGTTSLPSYGTREDPVEILY